MAKKKPEKPRHELTRRQRSRWQQQKRRQRIILSVAILIVVAVLSVVGVGVYSSWYVKDYKPLHETVIEVNDTKIDMEDYITMLEYMALQYESSYGINLTAELMSFLTESAEMAVEQNELIRQAAMELGISVSDGEVDEQLNSSDPPLSKDYRDLVRTQLIAQRLLDEYFEQQVPTYAEQRYIMAMFLESEAQANEVKARIEAGEDFTTLAGELSLDAVTKGAEGDLGWRPQDVLPLMIESPILEESAFNCEVGVLSQPIYEETKTKAVGYWLIEVISVDDTAEPTEAQVMVMLLGSEQEANDIRARLEAGEDFAELATEFSLHPTSSAEGGKMTLSPGTMTLAFDEFVFDPEVELETLSSPIRDVATNTDGGYWLIKVIEADDNRQIDDENRDMLKNDALNKWVEGLMEDPENKVVSYLDDEKTQWAISYITGG